MFLESASTSLPNCVALRKPYIGGGQGAMSQGNLFSSVGEGSSRGAEQAGGYGFATAQGSLIFTQEERSDCGPIFAPRCWRTAFQHALPEQVCKFHDDRMTSCNKHDCDHGVVAENSAISQLARCHAGLCPCARVPSCASRLVNSGPCVAFPPRFESSEVPRELTAIPFS